MRKIILIAFTLMLVGGNISPSAAQTNVSGNQALKWCKGPSEFDKALSTDGPISHPNKVNSSNVLAKTQGNTKLSYRQLFFKLLHHRCPLH